MVAINLRRYRMLELENGRNRRIFLDIDQGGYVFFPCRFVVLVKTILLYVKRLLSLYFN